MRYYKAIEISALTDREIDEFVADLLRADLANLRAGCVTPH